MQTSLYFNAHFNALHPAWQITGDNGLLPGLGIPKPHPGTINKPQAARCNQHTKRDPQNFTPNKNTMQWQHLPALGCAYMHLLTPAVMVMLLVHWTPKKPLWLPTSSQPNKSTERHRNTQRATVSNRGTERHRGTQRGRERHRGNQKKTQNNKEPQRATDSNRGTRGWSTERH